MTPPTKELLLPCPFCDGEAQLTGYSSAQSIKKYGDKIHWINCASKCAASGYRHDTEEAVIKAWNTRAYLTRLTDPTLVEVVAKAMCEYEKNGVEAGWQNWEDLAQAGLAAVKRYLAGEVK